MEIKNLFLKIIIIGFLLIPKVSKSQDIGIDNESNDDNDNPELFIYFTELNWKANLISDDIGIINSVIDRSDYRYKEVEANVMVPVLVHRLNSINEKENLFRWEEYRKYLNETKDFTDEEYDKFLLANIHFDKLKKNNYTSHYRAIEDRLLNALVIRQCRLLRNGKKQTVRIDEKMLYSFHKNIFEQSKFSDQQAIQNLTTKISNLGIVISEKELGILSALTSYRKEATENTLKIVKDSIALNKFSQRGKRFLLMHLLERAKIDLTKEEQKELLIYLNKDGVYNGIFDKQKDFICYLRNRITEENLESCFQELYPKKE
jgi:hypothetical protein